MGRGVDLQKVYKSLQAKSGGQELTKSLAGFDSFCKTLEKVDDIYVSKLTPNVKTYTSFVQAKTTPSSNIQKTIKKFLSDKDEFQKLLKPIRRDFLAYMTITENVAEKETDKAKKDLLKDLSAKLRVCSVLFEEGSSNICTMDSAKMLAQIRAMTAARHKAEADALEAEQEKDLQAKIKAMRDAVQREQNEEIKALKMKQIDELSNYGTT